MAKDDMFVVMYKILKYLYERMKTGTDAKLQDFCWDSEICKIEKQYWLDIIDELVSKGYVKGLSFISSTSGKRLRLDDHVKVTAEGVEFMQENSMMRKAKDAAGQAFDAVVAGLIGLI